MLWDILNYSIFTLAGAEITPLKLILSAITIAVAYLISRFIVVRSLDKFLEKIGVEKEDRSSLLRIIHFGIVLIGLYASLNVLSIQLTALLTTVMFTFAGSKITPLSIIMFFVTIIVVFMLSKFIIVPSLDRILKESNVEKESRASLTKLVHYFIVFLGIYIGLNVLGVKLTALLAVAGFTGIILGFGLQPIIANLISGFLLMGERTVRVGDWVEFDGMYGMVIDSGIRASTLRTLDNRHMLIPNRTFVESPFTNYSYRDRKIRITVPIGVAYGSEVAKVKKILLEIADDNEKVLESPKPTVLFTEFANSSLNFELKCWVSDPQFRKRVRSEINFEIDRRFAEENITIPFPQRDVWLKE